MESRPGTLREDLLKQRGFLRERLPVYARLLEALEAELDRGLQERLEATWRGRTFGAFYERPLLLLASLRDDALLEGEAHPLWRGIVAPEADPAAIDTAAVVESLGSERERVWRTLAERYVQTNEPTRAVAWLWPAALAGDGGPDRPIDLFDVGASAGLNLIADLLPPIWERDDGSQIRVAPLPPIASRVGFDMRPVNALDDDDARWLRACVWPGQQRREARLLAAIDAFRAAQQRPDAPEVRTAAAGDMPPLLPVGDDGRLALAYQTVVRDYIPADEWQRYRAGMLVWLASRPPGSALWVELELDGDSRRADVPPFALTAHVRGPGGVRALVLARCQPHPQQLRVEEAAVGEVVELLGGGST